MASLKFFLKNPQAKKKSLIYLIFQYGYYEIDPVSGRKKYKFLKISSCESVNPKYWNPETYRARETRSFPQHAELNARLSNLENTVFNVYRRMINNAQHPTPAQLKQELFSELNKCKEQNRGKQDRIGFFDFIRQLIDESYKGIRLTSGGKQFSVFTVHSYENTLSKLIEYQQSIAERIDFEIIDNDFYNSWVNWLYKRKAAKNTVGKHIKNLKVFMNAAFDRGLTKNTAFRDKKFKVLKEQNDTIYLNDEELDRMLGLDLSNTPTLERVRDYYLLDCYIGLRIADYRNLKKDHLIEIKGKKAIKIKLQKTGNTVVIPLRKNALMLLEKYDYQMKPLSNQLINNQIKIIGKMAGIDNDVVISLTRGGKKDEQVKKKYELITNHTARRSFATNLYLAGVPTLGIMKMTGHKTERAFLRYIRVTPEENALRVAEHPYFQ